MPTLDQLTEFSAALCRGLIEAGRCPVRTCPSARGFPRLYAAASLKQHAGGGIRECPLAFSAALCRGLIEARSGSNAYSSRNRLLIPRQTDHLFHGKPIAESSAKPITFAVSGGAVRGVRAPELSDAERPTDRETLPTFREGSRWRTGGCRCARFGKSCGCTTPRV